MEKFDENLVTMSKQGDMQAFKELIIRHQGKVAGVVKSMLRSAPEADDVGQEVFIRFYKALDKFKGESAVGTYLIRIAINLSLNEIKRKKRSNSFFAREEEGRAEAVEETDVDTKEMVNSEIRRLDPEFQSVVTLRMIEGYSTQETAKILGVPLGTVLSRLSRAQKKLKVGLERGGGT